jgi:hypothetical protein
MSRRQILPENMTKRKRSKRRGQRIGALRSLFGRILGSGGTRAGRTYQPLPPPALARVASARFRHQRKKEVHASPPRTRWRCVGSTSNENLLLSYSYCIYARGVDEPTRAPPSNRPPARGHARPPYVTDGVRPEAAAAHRPTRPRPAGGVGLTRTRFVLCVPRRHPTQPNRPGR